MKSIRRLLSFVPLPWFQNPPPIVSVVRLNGVIGGGGLRRGMSLAGLADMLDKAFARGDVRAVALAVNSPGGSPVQSALIAQRVRALSEEREIPVYAFVEDVAASGGYWLACAADEIYADPNSIVGSIGVISASFGLVDIIKRMGIERRLHTSGERKSLLDPFLPENPEEVARLKGIQIEIHENFKAMVQERRGDRLSGDPEHLFSGEFWTGKAAIPLGLIDGEGELRAVMKEKFGEKVRFRTARPPRRWPPFGGAAPGLGGATAWPDEALAAAEERLMWQRFGL